MFAMYRGNLAYERTIDTMFGQVALTAFYQTPDKATQFATTFFNQTIDIVETKKLVDVELISLYATILALLAGVGALKSRARVSMPDAQSASRAATQAFAWNKCSCASSPALGSDMLVLKPWRRVQDRGSTYQGWTSRQEREAQKWHALHNIQKVGSPWEGLFLKRGGCGGRRQAMWCTAT